MVVIGQKTLRNKLGIDVMAQLKASVLKAQGHQYGAGMEFTARSVGEPNDGAVLRAAMAVTAFVPGGDAPGDVDVEVALTLPSQRPMIFQDSEVGMRDRVGVLETAVDNAADPGSPPECAKMLRDIVSCTHLYVLCRALLGDPPARKKPVAVPFHSGARVVRAKPPPERNRLPWSAAVLPRLPLGGDDEFFVKVAWERLEEAESTWEPVSRVFDGATTVRRKEPKALRLKTDQKLGLVQRYGLRFLSYCGFGVDPGF